VADRTLIMGVLNVTPDSFSDGGKFLDTKKAIEHGLHLVEQGADIIDIGGESTRPGAQRVSPEEEQFRILPVISSLVLSGVSVSVDTMNASTAILAAEKGASYINDVSGGLSDYFMAKAVAATGITFIASHWRGHSSTMDNQAIYKDAPTDIIFELSKRVADLLDAGIARENLILDPGLGFAKSEAHNWQMLGRIDELQALGFPLLIGASRKRFLSTLLPENASLDERDTASVAVSILAANAGVWGVRVHDVARTAAAFEAIGPAVSGRPSDIAMNMFLTERQQSRARVEALEDEIAELDFDFDRELALAREVAEEERARQNVIAQLNAEASAARMMEQVAALGEGVESPVSESGEQHG